MEDQKIVNQKKNRQVTIAILIVFIIACSIFFYLFADMNEEGAICLSQPFVYGAQVVSESFDEGHMSCACSVYSSEGTSSYAFDEQGEINLNRFDTPNLTIQN